MKKEKKTCHYEVIKQQIKRKILSNLTFSFHLI